MYISQNQVTLAFCDLGSKTMLTEETKLRSLIPHKTAPANDKIMAFPYPSHYGIERWMSLNVTVSNKNNDLDVSYSIVFVHRCLLWQHTRVYSLTAEEYENCLDSVMSKYDKPTAHFVNDDNDLYVPPTVKYMTHVLYWYPEKITI